GVVGSISRFAFFFVDTATSELYTLSLHDALPILRSRQAAHAHTRAPRNGAGAGGAACSARCRRARLHSRKMHLRRLLRACVLQRSEEHTSELQSRENLVCRLLLEKKKKKYNTAQK